MIKKKKRVFSHRIVYIKFLERTSTQFFFHVIFVTNFFTFYFNQINTKLTILLKATLYKILNTSIMSHSNATWRIEKKNIDKCELNTGQKFDSDTFYENIVIYTNKTTKNSWCKNGSWVHWKSLEGHRSIRKNKLPRDNATRVENNDERVLKPYEILKSL